MEEIVHYVRAGSGIAFLPAPVSAAFRRPEIAYLPVTGVPPGQIALAWDAVRESALVTAFAEVVRQTVTGPAPA
jgi:DNA-binding transcriptional LysR family regulator